MQSGYGVCDAESPDAPNAYAVINLGHGREQGHLTVYLAANGMPGGVDTCAALRAYVDATMKASPDSAPGEVLFCSEGTAATPMLSGVRYYGVLTVTARYADRRAVWMESHPAQPGQAPTVDADALRTVVSDRALVDLLLR
jgi:hypothetical protein